MFTFGLNDVSRLLPMFYVILCSINLNYILYFIFLFQTCTADVIVQLNGVFGWINRPPTTGEEGGESEPHSLTIGTKKENKR